MASKTRDDVRYAHLTVSVLFFSCLVLLGWREAGVAAALVELEESDAEEGLSPVLQKYLEPTGVFCIAYVDANSKNHELFRRIAAKADQKSSDADFALVHLSMPMVAASFWREIGNESLTIVRRRPFRDLWPQVDMAPMDDVELVFPAKKGGATRKLRQAFSMGLDTRSDAKLLLVERAGFFPEGADEVNHWHGDPKKYRLQNLTEASIDAFFADFDKGTLPTYWVSREPWTWGDKRPQDGHFLRLTGPDFERVVLDEDPKRARMVAFFNGAEEDGCARCGAGRGVWEQVAQTVATTSKLSGRVIIAAIDQSKNEHPETLVAGKVAQPMVVWYPPGSRSRRLKKRYVLTSASESFSKESILEALEDILMESAEGDEL